MLRASVSSILHQKSPRENRLSVNQDSKNSYCKEKANRARATFFSLCWKHLRGIRRSCRCWSCSAAGVAVNRRSNVRSREGSRSATPQNSFPITSPTNTKIIKKSVLTIPLPCLHHHSKPAEVTVAIVFPLMFHWMSLLRVHVLHQLPAPALSCVVECSLVCVH